MEAATVLGPVVVLVAWTMVMFLWLYVTRLPAMRRAGIDLKGLVGGRGQNLDGVLDEKIQWKAHNYNHLMEQPTLFYAVALALALLGDNDSTTAAFAWAYVGLRIAHSLVQATINIVMIRFALFALSSGCLILLTIRLLAIALRASG
ncbi:MAPEG family protein [Sphingomonas xanthus]|uniref:MAPEG family protein n=1 Tax=Sphingomonas xanthus TaxID=2594473 RepID=A0A516IP01_9SPHN|nr:MAPEG family protein [Sphingomonas xanthus]QDP18576.1 MAPEG family protein [Sphingomonas xanthus]